MEPYISENGFYLRTMMEVLGDYIIINTCIRTLIPTDELQSYLQLDKCNAASDLFLNPNPRHHNEEVQQAFHNVCQKERRWTSINS